MIASQSTRRRLRLRNAHFRDVARGVFKVQSDYDIAVKLGVHYSTLSKLFTGKRQPGELVIVTVLDKLGGSFEEYFEIVDEAVDEPMDEAA